MKLKQFLKKVFEVYRPFKWAVAKVFVFIALIQALNLVTPYLQGKTIDALFDKKPLNQIWLLIGIALTASLIRTGLFYWRERYELNSVDFSIPYRMNQMTVSRLCEYSIGQHISENSGLKQSKINRGQHSLSSLAQTVLYQVIPIIVEVVLLTAATLYFNKIIGLILFAGVSLHIASMLYLNYRFKDEAEEVEKLEHEHSKFQNEVLRNIELVLTNARESRATKECGESLKNVQDASRKLWLGFVNLAFLGSAVPTFTRFLIFAVGASLVYRGQFTVGWLAIFLMWSNQALNQLSQISWLHRQLIQMYTSVKKYFDMLAVEPDVKVPPDPVSPDRFQGKIEFKNVTFRYKRRDDINNTDSDDDDENECCVKTVVGPALENMSFTVEAGETVAFVGESGSGKSTVVHALIRARDPEEGRIIIDGNDIRNLDLKRFRESVGVVNQQVSLFDHTLRYNITYGLNGKAAEISNAELDRIAEMSCVNRFFSRLEKGYDTIIGERGIKLSGGECQRVGIARALIKDPDILIFDEATSSLDSENEALIRASIEKASKGRTTIIIAHRFSTIRNVDKIIVLNKGRVAGIGAHDDLMRNCEPYRRLIENQISTF